MTNLYVELNKFMEKILNNIILSMIAKILTPALLLLYIIMRLRNAKQHQVKRANLLINICMSFYLLIIISQILFSLSFFILIEYKVIAIIT